MSKTVFYKKEGRKYIPVSEYNNEFLDAIPYDCAIIELKKEHSTMRRYKVDPSLAPFVAATMLLGDKITKIISDASEFKIGNQKQKELTPEQKEAWDKLDLKVAYGPSYSEIADSILNAITEEAEKMLTNDALQQQYEYFLTMATLSKDQSND